MKLLHRFWLAGTLVFALSFSGIATAEEDAEPFADLQLETVAEGFTAPLYLVTPPGDERRFVLDQVGQIHILQEDGTPRDVPFLDVSDRLISLDDSFDERGLLGVAFHPNYQENGRFFIYYSAPLREEGPQGWNHTSHLSEFRVSDDPNRADPDSERIIMQIDQPQFNHNGGWIAFGPDDYLYIGLGDGGRAGDTGLGHPPLGHGQDVTTLLGSILRIGVEEEPYSIPDDNPLVGKEVPPDAGYSGDEVREEIWAWGIRNAWGISFDRETDDFFVADVGQDLWEEVNRMKGPGNYGWNIKEGTHWFDPQDMQRIIEEGEDTGPMGEPLIDPIIEYRNTRGHDDGIGMCVIGGYVYRGEAIAELQGKYVFGDWTKTAEPDGVVIVAALPEEGSNELATLSVAMQLEEYVIGFGEDADGELYVLTSRQPGPRGTTGRVSRIVGARR